MRAQTVVGPKLARCFAVEVECLVTELLAYARDGDFRNVLLCFEDFDEYVGVGVKEDEAVDSIAQLWWESEEGGCHVYV